MSDKNGETALYAPHSGSVAASLHQRRAHHREFEQQGSVQCTTLDSFTHERGIDRIDLLKLDVEGHELAALRGADRLLKQGRIGAILFEFGAANTDSRVFLHDFWAMLKPLQFSFYRVLPGGRLLTIPDYRESLDGHGKSYYLAIRETARDRPEFN